VEDRTVLDLGCGCGMLSIAAVLMGAAHVVRRGTRARPPAEARAAAAHSARGTVLQVGVDVDDDALQIATSNMAQFEDLHIDLLNADVARLPGRLRADTVVTCAAAAACAASRSRPVLTSRCGFACQQPAVRHATQGRGHRVSASRLRDCQRRGVFPAQGASWAVHIAPRSD
jgi:hypothetical protein